MLLQPFLPDHHIGSDSKDAVKLGAGLIATMAALILGLLVASTKNSFDATNHIITVSSADSVYLDRVLALYGPEAVPIRKEARDVLRNRLARIWPEEHTESPDEYLSETSPRLEKLIQETGGLVPQTEVQTILKAQAVQTSVQLLKDRWLLEEEGEVVLPSALLVVPIFWLAMLNFIYALFAPRNITVTCVKFACSLSIAGAIFLIHEMSTPMDGLIKVSSHNVHKALKNMGK